MSAESTERRIHPPEIEATWGWMSWAVDSIGPLDPIRGLSLTPGPADRFGPTQCCALALPPNPRSARIARDFTRNTLRDWAKEERAEDAAVTVSELVTNALRYGQSLSAASTSQSSVWLGVWEQWSCAVGAVADSSDGIPVFKRPDQQAESGRGLHVVANLSDAWGWAPRVGPGKIVWAMFRT